MRTVQQWRLFLLAMQRYSRLPVTARIADWRGDDPAGLAPAIRYFPLVGLIVATLTAMAYAISGLLLPHSVALLVALTAGLLLTGARHEAGFARDCDAIAAPTAVDRTPERLTQDQPERQPERPPAPSIGAPGAAGLILILLGRYETLTAIDPSWVGVALVTAAGLSRGCAVAALLTLSPERWRVQAPAPLQEGDRRVRDAAIAGALALTPVMLAALWTGAIAVFGMASCFALAAAAWMRRRLRLRGAGCPGDGLSAVQQVSEVAFLIGALAMLALAADPTTIDPAAHSTD